MVLNVILFFAAIGLFAVFGKIAADLISDEIKRYTCKHETYHETMRCHARCLQCGKDLGFIGDVRGDSNKREIGHQRGYY